MGYGFRGQGHIDQNTEAIMANVERVAALHLPAAIHLDAQALRDHVPLILEAIVQDLRTAQTPGQAQDKSEGRAPIEEGAAETAAQSHALLRARDGFRIHQLVAEYRALRASVLRLWTPQLTADEPGSFDDMLRFNEAIDQVIAESVDFFQREVERWRHLFLGMIGHDLRSPLQAIELTARLMQRQATSPTSEKQADRLIRSGHRIQSLLDDLLDYSRSSLELGIPIRRAQVDMGVVCSEEIDLLRAAHPRRTIDFAYHGVAEGLYDASRVRQVLTNLVSNAVVYGDPHAPIAVTLDGDSDGIRLEVTNKGEATSPGVLTSLFDPLRRAAVHEGDESVRSTHIGLGLFIVREIAKGHGGGVEADSADGTTTFVVRLSSSRD